MKITDFDITISKDNVLHIIDCYPDSPIYEEVLAELEEMLPPAYQKLQPAALLTFGSTAQLDLRKYDTQFKQALYCVISVGGDLSKWSTKFFQEGNYLKGMLADAIADDYLFQMDHHLSEQIIALCKEKGCGISTRLEAPQDVPMDAQKTAWELTSAKAEIGLEIKESFMYDPVKSTCQIYLLDENSKEYHVEHNCSTCANLNCKMRTPQKLPVTVKTNGKALEINGLEKQSLLESFQLQGIHISAVCSGKGTCGKCKIRLLEGHIPPSKSDLKFFSPEALEKGYRLACTAFPNHACVIAIEENAEQEFEVIADTPLVQHERPSGESGHYGIAVDIGTTTIAMQLVNLDQKQVVRVHTAVNPQRAYGADVISRIAASNAGNAKALTECIQKCLKEGVAALLDETSISVNHMVIGCNTTMTHLLMGYSCKTLGIFPFAPVNIHTIQTSYKEMFECMEYDFNITVLPGISTYVGGDITAGLYACGFDKSEKVSVLIDLGTNGEMAIGCKDRILTTSTAAGPAFEGGNITQGMGSVPGAICQAEFRDGVFHVQTIGNRPAEGICGTGVVEITSELLNAGLVDETGLLSEEFFQDGVLISKRDDNRSIHFSQKDIREIQLAKAAVRAGLDALIIQYGIPLKEIETIYLAGGFGYKLNIQKAIAIGLLPNGCESQVKAIGNSSLNGCFQYLTEPDALMRIEQIIAHSSEFHLANDNNFNEFYMEAMYF